VHDNIDGVVPRSIGAQIRSLRLARGWSLAELARRVGSSAPTLHRYEGGWDRFELATLRKIASAFGARLEVRLVSDSAAGGVPAGCSPRELLKLIAPLFWDRELQPDDLERYPDWVLERVLMFGDWKQMVAARRFYGDAAVARAAERRGVDARTRNFWNTVLEGDAVASEGP
jgi:transcriptional regulator with XRE-family HTH domain